MWVSPHFLTPRTEHPVWYHVKKWMLGLTQLQKLAQEVGSCPEPYKKITLSLKGDVGLLTQTILIHWPFHLFNIGHRIREALWTLNASWTWAIIIIEEKVGDWPILKLHSVVAWDHINLHNHMISYVHLTLFISSVECNSTYTYSGRNCTYLSPTVYLFTILQQISSSYYLLVLKTFVHVTMINFPPELLILTFSLRFAIIILNTGHQIGGHKDLWFSRYRARLGSW